MDPVDQESLALQRLLVRDMRAHVDDGRALIRSTRRLLADHSMWRRFDSPSFGVADGVERD